MTNSHFIEEMWRTEPIGQASAINKNKNKIKILNLKFRPWRLSRISSLFDPIVVCRLCLVANSIKSPIIQIQVYTCGLIWSPAIRY